MTNPIFALLDEHDLLRDDRVDGEALARMSFSALLDLSEAIAAIGRQVPEKRRPSIHDHIASIAFGGGYIDCVYVGCRLKKASDLARFATLFSERVFAHNFVTDYAPSFGHAPNSDSDDFRKRVLDDLEVLNLLRPLITSGLVCLFSPVRTVCSQCAAQLVFGELADNRFKKANQQIANSFFDNMEVDIWWENGRYHIYPQGPEEFFDHGGLIHPYELSPRESSAMTRLMARIDNGERVKIPKNLRKRLDIHKGYANGVMDGLGYQLTVAQILGGSFLTHRQIHHDALRAISGRDPLQETSRIPANILRFVAPFIEDVPISKLVQLREREPEALVRFRAALTRAAREFSEPGKVLSPREAAELYSDVVAPALAKLDQKVRESKKELVRGNLSSAAATVATVGLGVYSGLIPADLVAAAEALGLGKVLRDTLAALGRQSDVLKTAPSEEYFFLWKVKQLSD